MAVGQNLLTNKNVLVTGAAGFIASHLVEEVLAQGASVRAFVRYNSKNNWGWLETLSTDQMAQVQVFSGDIRDFQSVRKAMKDIDLVFHLGALITIPYSYEAPQSYVDTNIQGTLNVLESAKDLKCERVVITSTSEVYGTALTAPIEETHPRQAQSPYAASKVAADALSESYYRSFDLPVTIVRPFNTYGPRQSARAVIPAIITQLLSGKDEVTLGSLTPTRDLLFVEDTARGFIHASRSEELLGQDVNLCTGQEIAIGDLARILIEIINPKARLVCDEQRVRPANSEVNRLIGSSKKLEALTGWRSETSLRHGLEQTVEWFRKNLHLYKSSLYNV